MPEHRAAKSSQVDHHTLAIMKDLAAKGALFPESGWARGVLIEYTRSFPDLVFKQEQEASHLRLSKPELEKGLKERRRMLPRRWQDTTRKLRQSMYLYSCLAEQDNQRSFTLWIGTDLISLSVSTKQPLAALLNKRINERLKRHLPDLTYGLWFSIECTQDDPWALHAHGLFVVGEGEYLKKGSKQNRALRTQLRAASGSAHTHKPDKILDMHQAAYSVGWIDYARAWRSGRRYTTRLSPLPPADIGRKVDVTSHQLIRLAHPFYENTRQVLSAVITGKLLTWTEVDWAKVNPDSI